MSKKYALPKGEILVNEKEYRALLKELDEYRNFASKARHFLSAIPGIEKVPAEED